MTPLMSRTNLVLACIGLLLFISSCKPKEEMSSRVDILTTNWKIQAQDKLAGIEESSISKNDFNTKSWIPAMVPGTIIGSLTNAGLLEDPTFGVNMKKINLEQFQQPWWYRTTVQLSAKDIHKRVNLHFNGINYRAELWINGKKAVADTILAGTFRMHTININDYIQEGENTLALKIKQQNNGEFSLGFCDWNPLPPDRSMGIYREVFLEVNEGIKIRSPFVYSKVDTISKTAARLFIQTEIENTSDQDIEGTLTADFTLGKVEKKLTIKAHETLSWRFTPEEFSQLSVKNVKLWWPNGMGTAQLYSIKTTFESHQKVLDQVEKKYGIREITSALNADKNRYFKINGKFVLPKGGGWADDIFLRDTRQSVEAQLRYVRHMNLNSIRCEGFWGKDDNLYDLCDEYGIMVMIGWSCIWEWDEYLGKSCHPKYGGAVSPADISLLADSWKDQLLWLRNHPCIYMWMLGSDKLPHPDLEKKYVDLFTQFDPSRPYATSAGGAGTDKNNIVAHVPLVSDISGPTGMKMLGPYAWTPPHYWYTDTTLGGAWGFNTETCPGASIAPLASLQKMMPEKSLWPIDKEIWEYHTGRNEFTSLDRDINAINQRYGKSSRIEEFCMKAQANNYEIMRPQFEAFIAHKPKSTGIVQWQLNSAWPKLIWQLYDTYLQPNGSFYGVKKACTPLHAIYRYGFNDIYLANEDLSEAKDLTVKIRVIDLNSKEVFADEWKGNIPSNISEFIYKLPEIKNLTTVWFLDLRIVNAEKKEVDNSIYWLSSKKDELDYEGMKKLPWAYYTPTKNFADYSALNSLPKVKLSYEYQFSKENEFGKINLKVKNTSKTIAFFTFFDVLNAGTSKPILPVFWNDNYVSVLPGEERTYEASYFLSNSDGKKPVLKINGWNVESEILK